MSGLSLAHRLWRALPAGPRRRIVARAVALAAPSIVRPAPLAAGGVIVVGELSRASGLGEGARLMLRALEALGVPNWPLDIGPLLPAHSPEIPVPPARREPPGRDAALVLHVNPPLLPLVLARLGRRWVRGRRIVGYWAWELPIVQPDWHRGAAFVHEAWTPSTFTAAALSPLVDGAVRVVGLPLTAMPPLPSALDRAAFGLPNQAVVVLTSFNLASSFERKNPLGAIAAFRAAFGDRADRILVLKIGHAEHAPEDFLCIANAAAGMANVRLETRLMPRADAHALTACSDLVLSLHRSEGFGLIPAEAMLLGRPVVATGWSGNMDFMDAHSAALVGYRLVPARDPRGVYDLPGAFWAEPDIEIAADWLRRLADDAALRASIGAAGREAAFARLGPEPLAEAVRGLASCPLPRAAP